MTKREAATSPAGATARHTEHPLRLAWKAAGGPAEALGKAGRLARLFAGYARPRELDDKLAQLQARGIIDAVPTRIQLALGARDMLRFWIVPASEEYYADQGIDFRFHQLLRFLDEPASLADPVGFFSTKDAIIGHVMQVVHANPRYDLELLSMYEDGLPELQSQIEAMIAGTHLAQRGDLRDRRGAGLPRSPPRLHAPLPRGSVRAGAAPQQRRREPSVPAAGAHLWLAPHGDALLLRLPSDPLGAARHLFSVREFPDYFGEAAQTSNL